VEQAIAVAFLGELDADAAVEGEQPVKLLRFDDQQSQSNHRFGAPAESQQRP
jgi:hypothetical protein